jgi:hypothetical protein
MESNGDRWEDENGKVVNGGHPRVFIGHSRASVLISPSATAEMRRRWMHSYGAGISLRQLPVGAGG